MANPTPNPVAAQILEKMEVLTSTRLQERILELKETIKELTLAEVSHQQHERTLVNMLSNLTGFLTVTGQSPAGYEEALAFVVEYNLARGRVLYDQSR